MKNNFTMLPELTPALDRVALRAKYVLTCFVLILFSLQLSAQNTEVRGRINDDKGEGLPGVTVLVRGTTNGTVTDANGAFSINAPSNGTLVISYVGYNTQEVAINGRSTINVSLATDSKALEELVVVGYGVQKKGSVTGAISQVSAKQISELPVPNVQQAIQGRTPGVLVVNTGTPGTNPIVRIRGIGSVSFGTDPLYIVDGVPTTGLNNIDPKDIQSVDVLKDAAATAIYGSRAANGVVLVTTKSGGKDGKFRISVDSNVGTQAVTKMYDVLNTEQYVQYGTTLIRNNDPSATLPPRFAQLDQPIGPNTTQTYRQTNTNWQKELFKSGIITQNNISLAGGTDKSQVYTSLGYFKQEGTMQGTGFQRYNARVNSTHKINNIFTVGQQLTAGFNKQQYDPSGTRTRIVNAIRFLPYLPVYDPTVSGGFRGVSGADASDPENPIRLALMDTYERRNVNILGNMFVEAKITDWLRFKTIGGIDYYNNLDYRFLPLFNDGFANRANASIQNNRSTGRNLVNTNQLTFDKTFGDHYVNAIAVQEYNAQKALTENATGSQPNNTVQNLFNAIGPAINFNMGENTLISYLTRVNYEYKGKYLLSASFRRDGSSKFAPAKKWGNFPGASIGWRLTEEPFMKGITQLSDLKLRASYGKVGFNGLGNYDWMVNASVNGTAYPFNNNPTGVAGSYYTGIQNLQLGWEITTMVNYGVDLGLLNNKVTFSAEYFDRKTVSDENGLILYVPTSLGYGFGGGTVAQNVGRMQNRGFELSAGYNENEKPFKWSINANATMLKNKVLAMSPSTPFIEAGSNADFGNTNFTRTEAGQPIQAFYGWVVDRLFQSADDVKNSPKQEAGTAAGDIKFKDLNNDGVINNSDRTFLGSYLPKVQYGINGTASFKNFDFSVFLQGSQGNKVYNATRVILEGGQRLFNAGTNVLNAWTPTNTNTDVPRMVATDPNRNNRTSTRFLENGSYARLRNLSLGYTIPQTVLSSFTNGKVSSFRIYVQSTNLFTITKYSGLDPEVGNLNGANTTGGNLLMNGIDFGQYPTPRSFVGGIQLNF